MLVNLVRVILVVEVVILKCIRALNDHAGGLLTELCPIMLGQQSKQSVFPAYNSLIAEILRWLSGSTVT